MLSMPKHVYGISVKPAREQPLEVKMVADEFVQIIDLVVRKRAIETTERNLARPPGARRPSDLLEMANWYAQLPQEEKDILRNVLSLAVSHAVLGFLSVLDGAQAIEEPPHKGHLELYYVSEHHRILLNDPKSEPLNDKLRP